MFNNNNSNNNNINLENNISIGSHCMNCLQYLESLIFQKCNDKENINDVVSRYSNIVESTREVFEKEKEIVNGNNSYSIDNNIIDRFPMLNRIKNLPGFSNYINEEEPSEIKRKKISNLISNNNYYL